MPTKQLPSRPSLDHLKHQARDLVEARRAGNPEAVQRIKGSHPEFAKSTEEEIRAAKFALSDAQLVIAREYGFESWAKLKTHVEAVARGDDPAIAAFLMSAVAGNQMEGRRLLMERPALARANIYTASILGEADTVEAILKKEPTLATRKGGPKDWAPLLYASASPFHGDGEKRAAGIVDVARVLLANGADPNSYFLWEGDGKSKQSALYLATCEANNPALARVLLEAGADPNDGESIYHAAEKYHIECLELLAEFGVKVSDRIRPWNNTPLYFVLGHKPSSGMAATARKGVQWLLENGADPNVPAYEFEGRPIHLVASNGWDVELLDLMFQKGADINARRKDGRTAYALAVRHGHTHVADGLRDHGAQTDLTSTDEFFAACSRGDEPAVRSILAKRPELIQSLTEEDRRLLADAAGDGKAEAVRLMLLAGMPVDAHGDDGVTPLHEAAWWGQLEVVKLLLARLAPLDVRDTSYDATPLGWTTHGSINCRNPQGDYPGIVEALLQAGAKVEKPRGTEEVQAVMRRYSTEH